MARESPLNPLHQQAEASFLGYAASGSVGGAGGERSSALVVESFGELEGEYAALRKGCVLLDCPQRGTLRVTGPDRIEFLNRMVTQEMKGIRPFQVRESFWLNRRGRIDADLRLIELDDEMLVDVDVLSAGGAANSLAGFVISESVEVSDESERMHRLCLHGPSASLLLSAVSEGICGPPAGDLTSGMATVVKIGGRRVVVDREDVTGEPGLGLLMRTEDVRAVYEQLLERGLEQNGSGGFRMRPAGWHAFNIARIEAGVPLFNIDFGADSLPAETGLLERRVSFTKGCYLGQEVVARMHSLGHPKQVLVGVRVEPEVAQSSSGRECQPVTGSAVFRSSDGGLVSVGAVTSSARSPMLGDAIVCFAAVKWGHHAEGTDVLVEADAGRVPGRVQKGLRFWRG